MSEINKGGRPKKEIDQKQFETMCAYQCTKDEICGILDIDEKTLTRWCKDTYNEGFSDTYKKKSKVGLISLRRTQWKLAEKHTAMAIWLGKQYLGQKDKVEYTDDGVKSINENIVNIANLLNNPKPNRTEEDV